MISDLEDERSVATEAQSELLKPGHKSKITNRKSEIILGVYGFDSIDL